ncbi:hypothetical protein NHX12_015039 [Muraenolepis orangiensis]|uniref:G-protein coupled receptors family 1 profile domain-containing protein n=1 Tax=Muraenolepis orangiensis TaxID=630683 RepID=A0A9Q0I3H9_9TELE|nr:hypothetical protein NHX12_015039 [Muraenolepis orangiensis]
MALSFNVEEYFDFNATTNLTATYTVDANTLVCSKRFLSTTVARLLCFIYVAICHIAIPGNVLVAWVICVNRRSLTPSDVYLFHLTIADLLLALTLPFRAAVAGLQSWIFGDVMCKLVSVVTEANFYTSILFLVCISVDRYLAVVHATRPHKGHRWRFRGRLACASVWVLGVALALPALFNDAFELGSGTPARVTCSERYDMGSAPSWRLATRALRHLLGFLLPLAVMLTCYGVTLARLLRTHGFRRHRAMRVIVAVVAAFLLCWTPYHLALVTDTLMRADLVDFDCAARRAVDMAQLVTQSLALSHCCVNPVLYAIIGEKFRNNLATLRVRQDAASRPRFSRSASQTSEGAGKLI